MGAGNVVEGMVLGFVRYGVLLFFYERFAVFDLGLGTRRVRSRVSGSTTCGTTGTTASRTKAAGSGRATSCTTAASTTTCPPHSARRGRARCRPVFLFSIPLVVLGFHPVMLAFVARRSTPCTSSGSTPRPSDRLPAAHRGGVQHPLTPPGAPRPQCPIPRRKLRRHADRVGSHGSARSCQRIAPKRCRYGLVKNLGTFNPLRIALHETVANLSATWSGPACRWATALRYVFGPPGWSHDGSRAAPRPCSRRRGCARTLSRRGCPGLACSCSTHSAKCAPDPSLLADHRHPGPHRALPFANEPAQAPRGWDWQTRA